MRPVKVYDLVDPRDGATFYVGMSYNEGARAAGHCSDKSTPIWGRIRQIREDGLEFEVRVVESFPTRALARSFERRRIATTPGLLNKDVHKCRVREGLAPRRRKERDILLKDVPKDLRDWLETERASRGLRSRQVLLMAILTEARGGK